MVKKMAQGLMVFCFVFVCAAQAFAASFTATVDRTSIAQGDSLTLQLSLSGAGAMGSPDLSPLEDAFKIYSQGQSNQTTIINGRIKSSVNWVVTLIPQSLGKVMIPALTIDTDGGKLTSDPLEITVTKGTETAQDGDHRNVYVEMEVSKRNPYRNEPILVTAKLVSKRSLSDVAVPDYNVAHAVTQQQGKPEVYDGVVAGQRVKVIEVNYLVTPLQDGPVTLPGVSFEGKAEGQPQRDPFGRQFGNFPDPFGMFEDFGLPGMSAFQPFAVTGENTTLNVKAPAAPMDPWLPVKSLQVLDQWDNDGKTGATAKVGEPMTRKLVIMADGATGASLPNLEDQIDPQGNFKIYADNPTTGEDLKDGNKKLEGWREESYTLIPQKAGTLTLPEIKVAYWDLGKSNVAYATVPAKTITVAPGAAGAQGGEDGSQPAAVPALVAAPAASPEASQEPAAQNAVTAPVEQEISALPGWLYPLVGGMAALVVILAGAVVVLLMKQRVAPQGSYDDMTRTAASPANEDRISGAALKKATSAAEIRSFLQAYAHQHWGMAQNAPLKTIYQGLCERYPGKDLGNIGMLFDRLDAALYAGKDADVEKMKQGFAALLRLTGPKTQQEKRRKETLGGLNPS